MGIGNREIGNGFKIGKKMKVICTIIVMILLALCIGGCRSVKQSERLGSKLTIEEQRQIKGWVRDSQQIVLSRSVLDSSGQVAHGVGDTAPHRASLILH